jgi:hypothetical protein
MNPGSMRLKNDTKDTFNAQSDAGKSPVMASQSVMPRNLDKLMELDEESWHVTSLSRLGACHA